MAKINLDVAMESTSQEIFNTSQEILSKMGQSVTTMPVKPIRVQVGQVSANKTVSGTGRCVLFLKLNSFQGTVTADGVTLVDSTDKQTTSETGHFLVENSFSLKVTTNNITYFAVFF